MPRPRVIGQPASRRHFTGGIDAIANLLAPTLGPVGGIVANHVEGRALPELLDDSGTVVRRIIQMHDPSTDVGAMLMRNMIWRVGQQIGDGGATTAVLTRAIHADASRLIVAGINAMQLISGINAGSRAVIQAIRAMAQPVRTENELAAVALGIVKNRDLAAVLGEMSYLLGPDAHVAIEKYVAPYLQQYYHPGGHYKASISSMYFYTDQVNRRSIVSGGVVALVDNRIESPQDAVALLQAAMDAGARSLTIIAHRLSESALSVLLANNRTQSDDPQNSDLPQSSQDPAQNSEKENEKKEAGEDKRLQILAVDIKFIGDERRMAFEDLSLLTGAVILGRDFTKSVAQAKAEDLGRILRAEAGTETMYLLPEKQYSAPVQAKAAELRSRLAGMTQDDEARPAMMRRLSALNGGVGQLKVGTISKQDREIQANLAERALKVLSAAQYGGVVPGAGAALVHAIPALDQISLSGDAAVGLEVLRRTLSAPLYQILQNAGVDAPAIYVERVREGGPTTTYDALTGQVVDAVAGGVLDVANVVCGILEIAVSGATMALSTDTIVYHKKPEQSMQP